MRTMRFMVPVLVSAVVAFALAGGTRVIEQGGIRVALPDNWSEKPEIAQSAADTMLKTSHADGGAFAYGELQRGGLALGQWQITRQTVTEVRSELSDVYTAMRSTMEKDNSTFSRWDVSETATRMSCRFDGRVSNVAALGVVTAGVDRGGHIHTLALMCFYADANAATVRAECERALDATQFLLDDADLQPIPPRG